MDVKIFTLKQVENLLRQQIGICRATFDKGFNNSNFKQELDKIDEHLPHKIHEVRDKILESPFPTDIEIMKVYMD